MSWSAPVPDDVLSELTPAEAAAFQAVLGGSTPEAKVAPILTRVVAEIRGYISGGGYALDADPTTLPPSLLSDAVVMTRWRLLTTIPEIADIQSKERKAAYDDSIKKLNLIAKQKFAVDEPIAGVNPPSGQWNAENKLMMRTHSTPRPSVQTAPAPPSGTDYANPNVEDET